MNIFMIGATGYIGNAVARKLQSEGHRILALSRKGTSTAQLEAMGFSVIEGDMFSPATWRDQASQAEAFIHCGQLRTGKRIGNNWIKKAAHADQVAFKGMLDAARQGKNCKTIIYTSGISVVGDHGNVWTDENTTPKPGRTVGSYHLQGERIALQAADKGLPVVVLRPSLPVSSGGTFANFFLKHAAKGKLQYVGRGDNYFPTVHLDDLAVAYARTLERSPVGETIIVSDDDPLTMRAFTNTLMEQFGHGKAKPVPKIIVSLFAGKPLANLLVSSFQVKNQKAKDLLGWKPQYPTFYQSLEQVITNGKKYL